MELEIKMTLDVFLFSMKKIYTKPPLFHVSSLQGLLKS